MSLMNITCVQGVNLIFIFIEKLWYVQNYQKPRQSKARQDQARQNKMTWHPEKKVSPGFEKYYSYWN